MPCGCLVSVPQTTGPLVCLSDLTGYTHTQNQDGDGAVAFTGGLKMLYLNAPIVIERPVDWLNNGPLLSWAVFLFPLGGLPATLKLHGPFTTSSFLNLNTYADRILLILHMSNLDTGVLLNAEEIWQDRIGWDGMAAWLERPSPVLVDRGIWTQGFESWLSQTNNLVNWYLSLRSQALGIIRIEQWMVSSASW